MTEFQYVPDEITALARDTLARYGVTLERAEYLGGYSAYHFTCKKGDKVRNFNMAYNFRANELEWELIRAFNVAATIPVEVTVEVDEPEPPDLPIPEPEAVEVVEIDQPDLPIPEPEAVKPTKRGKK